MHPPHHCAPEARDVLALGARTPTAGARLRAGEGRPRRPLLRRPVPGTQGRGPGLPAARLPTTAMTDLRKVDVVQFLTELGMRNLREDGTRRGVEVRFSCPFPGHAHGDSNPSATMNADSTAYRCWGCGMKGNAITFLAELEGVSPVLASQWIRERFEGGWRSVGEGGLWGELRNILEREKEAAVPVNILDEEEGD